MEPEDPTPRDVRAAAAAYIARGWPPVVLLPASKKPAAGKGWQSKRYTPDDFRGDSNLGLLLGKRPADDGRSLVDVDHDVPEARALGALLFADMPAFGRPGVPGGHRFAYCTGAPQKIVQFRLSGAAVKFAKEQWGLEPDPDGKTVFVELRANGQTMVPPSMHPDGRVLAWEAGELPTDSDLPTYQWEELLCQVRLLAFLAAVLRAYPRVAGSRDEACLALTGTLLRAGCSDEETDRLVVTVAELADDEEAAKRGGKAAGTRAKQEAGEPTTGLPHLCELLGIEPLEKDLRKWLGLERENGDALPEGAIVMRGGALHEIVDEAEAALLATGAGVYQRGEMLVRVARVDVAAEETGVRRDAGATVLLTVTPSWLLEQMGRAAPWVRYVTKDTWVRRDPEALYVRTLLARVGSWRFPVLRGLTRAPTLDRNGEVVQRPGYDPSTQLYLDFAEGAFPPVPEQPTREEAKAALERLDHVLRGFPFASEADRSVALSAFLTGLVRRSLRTAPLHGFDAPTAGTGKSLLAETIGVVVTGHKPAAMAQGKSDEEDEKRLSTLLRAGDPVLLVDNCERQLSGDFLCSMLTQEVVQARLLGMSERVLLPSSALVLATGNNLTLAGDMSRRAVVCRLDSHEERPDAREFDFDPREEAAAARGELVVAGLTVLRAYVVAGRPERLQPVGSFEDWTWVRGALVWLGRADPADTRAALMENDPRKGQLAEVLAAWEAALGDEPATVAEIRSRCRPRYDDPESLASPEARLVGLLAETAGRGHWDPAGIGRWLRKHRDRVVGGRALVVDGCTNGAQRWALVRTGGAGRVAPVAATEQEQEEIPF